MILHLRPDLSDALIGIAEVPFQSIKFLFLEVNVGDTIIRVRFDFHRIQHRSYAPSSDMKHFESEISPLQLETIRLIIGHALVLGVVCDINICSIAVLIASIQQLESHMSLISYAATAVKE